MTQAPTPGPLTATDWRVGDFAARLEDHPLVKAGEVNRVTEMFRGGYLGFAPPVGGEWNPRGWGKCDADGWMPWSGGENPVPGQRVQWRTRNETDRVMSVLSNNLDWTHECRRGFDPIIAFRLAPTAPVEASGSERDIRGETFMGFRVAAWRYRQGDETDKLPHHYAEHWSTPGASAWGIQRLFTEDQLQQALNLHPSPTPAADADRVREAVTIIRDRLRQIWEGDTHLVYSGNPPEPSHDEEGDLAKLANEAVEALNSVFPVPDALAALKSTAAKEGESDGADDETPMGAASHERMG